MTDRTKCRKTGELFDAAEPEFQLHAAAGDSNDCPCGKNECILHSEGDCGSLQMVEPSAPEEPHPFLFSFMGVGGPA